jgi:hypothetical protein
MRMMERLRGNQSGFTTVAEKCPCQTASTCASHSPTTPPEARKRFYADLVRPPACAAQTEALYRISFHRSHQKRGPPASLLL